jgi:hypothetical protein
MWDEGVGLDRAGEDAISEASELELRERKAEEGRQEA